MAFFRTVTLSEQLAAIVGERVALRAPQMSDFAEWAALRGRKLRQGGGCTLARPSQYSYFFSSETPQQASRPERREVEGRGCKARARR